MSMTAFSIICIEPNLYGDEKVSPRGFSLVEGSVFFVTAIANMANKIILRRMRLSESVFKVYVYVNTFVCLSLQ